VTNTRNYGILNPASLPPKKVAWNNNRKLRLLSERNWYDVEELNNILNQARTMSLNDINNLITLFDNMSRAACILQSNDIGADRRFPADKELISEDHGYWALQMFNLN